jgi:DNA-binding Lrp family transcriptional regulator
MLNDLLRELARPAPRSLADIATLLGTTPERLGIALEQCERLGYLDRGGDACSPSACGGCVVACGLVPGDPRTSAIAPRWWRLTERGRRAVAMGRPNRLGGPNT